MLDPKFSHLVRAGAVVHSADGAVYRCTSKLASGGTIQYRFADLQGKAIKGVPPGLLPLSIAHARFASWMRYVVAYNKDFDMYVKEAIKAAGLPVDAAMNWSKWLDVKIVPKMFTKDDEVRDEALHYMLVKLLIERNILSNFHTAIKSFNQQRQDEPLERQVTTFLISNFMFFSRSHLNDYIKKFVHQEDTDSMWGTEDGDEESATVNLLDKEEFAHGGGQDIAEADVEVDQFRRGFSDYLHNKLREDTADQYLTLFDLLYEEVKASDEAPKTMDIYPEWYRETGTPCPECKGVGYTDKERTECGTCEGKGATGGKSLAWFKVLFANLPKYMNGYIEAHKIKLNDLHAFLQIMCEVGKSRKEKQQVVHASLGGLKLADENEDDHQDGGINFNVPAAIGNIGEAMGVEELAPLALLAGKEAAQWEVPQCRNCPSKVDLKDCPACKDKFCADCILNHHRNNPSHERLASKKAGFEVDADTIYDVLHGRNFDYTSDGEGTGTCDSCNMEKNVVDISGYRNPKGTPNDMKSQCHFRLCSHCLNKGLSRGE